MSSVSVSVITTTFVPPADEPSIVGYYPSGTDVGTIVCGTDYEFLVSSTYGVCCNIASKGACDFKAACSKSMVVYADGSVATCPNDNPCVDTTMYQNAPSNGWSATMAWCVDPDNAQTLYRSYVGTQITLVSGSSHPTTSHPTTTFSITQDILTPSSTSTATTSSPTTTSIESAVPIEAPHGSKSNTGAIAGGVVGGVAGLALILGAIWYIWRRQSQKNAEMREIGTGYTPAPQS